MVYITITYGPRSSKQVHDFCDWLLVDFGTERATYFENLNFKSFTNSHFTLKK